MTQTLHEDLSLYTDPQKFSDWEFEIEEAGDAAKILHAALQEAAQKGAAVVIGQIERDEPTALLHGDNTICIQLWDDGPMLIYPLEEIIMNNFTEDEAAPELIKLADRLDGYAKRLREKAITARYQISES